MFFLRHLNLILVLLMSLPHGAWARRANLIPGSPYTSARSAALGDAGMPLGEDVASGLFNNPAILARVKEMTLEPLNLSLGANSDFLGHIGTKNSYNVTSLSSYQPDLARFQNYFPGVSGAILPNFGFRGFGVGLLYENRVSGTVDSSTGNIHYRSNYQFIPAAGFGFRLASGVIRIGYSLQYVNQAYGDKTVAKGTSPLGYNQKLYQGSGLSHTAAFSLNLPYTYLPAFNLVARNVRGANFSSSSLVKFSPTPTGAPPTETATYDASVSYQNKTGSGGSFNISAVMRDIRGVSDAPAYARLALGMEFSFRDVFFLRGGWGNMSPHAGIGFRQKKGELSLAWFEEDVGTTYKAETERRYLLQYQIRAF